MAEQQQQPQLRIEKLLREMVNRNASDLHLRVGVPPVYRINGALQRPFDVKYTAIRLPLRLIERDFWSARHTVTFALWAQLSYRYFIVVCIL